MNHSTHRVSTFLGAMLFAAAVIGAPAHAAGDQKAEKDGVVLYWDYVASPTVDASAIQAILRSYSPAATAS